MEVHTSGPLALFVTASMSVVGLLPAVFYRGSLLVDGGYSCQLPADVIRDCFDPLFVLAVDVR
jgi:predicted acylesterase/phospholipase RssA